MKVRSLFISDTHIGNDFCNHQKLLQLISNVECDYLYLIGDIIDGWSLKRKFKWHNNYNTIFQKILRLSRKGTKVYYVYGNHDDFLSSFNDLQFGENIVILRELVHVTITGKKILIIHGDQFDGIITDKKWVQHIGSIIYDISLTLNVFFRFFKFSFSGFLKNKAKEAVKYITGYENVIVNYCKLNNCDGIVTGHIHNPVIKQINNIDYYNTGDWIEPHHNTAIVEHLNGDMELIYL